MHNVFLGLGSNLGDRRGNLWSAIAALHPHVSLVKKSSLYESIPHGVAGEQPLYLNMVVHGTTSLVPAELLETTQMIERMLGRQPHTHRVPRLIDIDILAYDDEILKTSDLSIPHTEMHKRAFVLVPFEEIAASHIHPAIGKPVVDLLDKLGAYDEDVWLAEEQL